MKYKNLCLILLTLLIISIPFLSGAIENEVHFNVKDYGATGNGQTIDTEAINKAIEACNKAGGGIVLFPIGTYMSGTIYLKSNVTLHIPAGTIVRGVKDYEAYVYLSSWRYKNQSEAAANEVRPFIYAEDCENVAIIGGGTIDGNDVINQKLFDEYVKVKKREHLTGWRGSELDRGPHTILMNKSKEITIKDIKVIKSPNYGIRFRGCQYINIDGYSVQGGWDGINITGSKYATISNCNIQSGDDGFALHDNDHFTITNCLVNSACNAFRLQRGNRHLLINNCILYGPAEYQHISSHRKNVVTGITIRPSSKPNPESNHFDLTNDVRISNITMTGIRCPFDIGIYNGNSGIKNVFINDILITDASPVASVIEGDTDLPIENVSISNVRIQVQGGGEQRHIGLPIGHKFDLRGAYGFYCSRAKNVEFHNVVMEFENDDARPAIVCEKVDFLELDNVRVERSKDNPYPIQLEDVKRVYAHDLMEMAEVSPEVLAIDFESETDNLVEGEPFCALVQVKSDNEGLAKVELEVDGETQTRWVWMQAGEHKNVRFNQTTEKAGQLNFQAGAVSTQVPVSERPAKPVFVYSGLNVDSPIAYNEIQASVNVKNIGNKAGTEKVELKVDAKTVGSKQIALEPGEIQSVSFTSKVSKNTSPVVSVENLPAKIVAVPGEVQAPYKIVGDRKNFGFQFGNDNHFYVRWEDTAFNLTDEFECVYLDNEVQENSTVMVKILNPHKKGGWNGRTGIVLRNDLEDDFSDGYVALSASGSNGWSMDWDTDGDGIFDKFTPYDGYTEWPSWLKIERNGNEFTGYYSLDKTNWTKVANVTIPSAKKVMDAGMFVFDASSEFENFEVINR